MRNYCAASMAAASNVLMIECRMALGLTQEQLGNLVGRTKRTVQRWEDRGALLVAEEAEALAHALHPVRPDLAAQIAAIGHTTLEQLGLAAQADGESPVTTHDPVELVVRAAAEAMGVTPDTVRPAVAAAFVRAREAGLDVRTVAGKLAPGEKH
jgi:DNA-binding XRE family transcriptional regulator